MKHDFAEFWASLGGGQGAPGQATGTSASALTSAATSQQVIDLIHSLYDLNIRCWEALNTAYWYLSRAGLIYPDELLDRKVFKDFLTIPVPAVGGWPHVPVSNPDEECHLYPTTPIEQPAVPGQAYPQGSKPSVFLNGIAGVGGTTAPQLSTMMWIQTASRELDTRNYDLDADRGIVHACWTIAGSINDTPINVVELEYSET